MKKLKDKLEALPKDLFELIIGDSKAFLKALKALYNSREVLEHQQLSVALREINQKMCFVTDKMHTLLSSSWDGKVLKDG